LLGDLGDVPRMTALASDTVRHDRMLGLTGGDAAALTEIRAALDAITAQDHPDLAAALYLACHRDQLTARNTNIPPNLPAVWAALGNTARPLALAASIPGPDDQARALAQVAEALADAGQHQRAEQVARSISDPDHQARTLAQVAGALADAGQHQRAEQV